MSPSRSGRIGGRGVTIGIALVALAVVIGAWLWRSLEPHEYEVPTPGRPEALRDRFHGAKAIVRALGATVESPSNFEALPAPATTLVLSSSHWNFLPERDAALRRWVEAGGRLVLVETAMLWRGLPDWVPIESSAREDETADEGAAPAAAADRASAGAASAPEPPPGFEARRRDPCHRMSEPARVVPAFAASRSFRVCGYVASRLRPRVEPSWQLDDRNGSPIVRVPLGAGSVTASAIFSGFTEKSILDEDNALAFVAMLDLRPGDRVSFVDEERRDAFVVWLWRLQAPALALLAAAIALVLWRRGARFGPLRDDPAPARRSVGEQVRRSAAFIAASGGAALHAASLRSLDDTARQRIPGYARDAPIGDRAGLVAARTGVDRSRLGDAMSPPSDRRRLGRALADLEAARRAMRAIDSTPSPEPHVRTTP